MICSSCNQNAVTDCQGCSKAFCWQHMNDHRRSLGDGLKAIINECDQTKKIASQRKNKPDTHPLIQEIKKWEEETITKIRQHANKLRDELKNPIDSHTSDLLKKLDELSEQLKQHHTTNNFIEKDIAYCREKLNNFKIELTAPPRMVLYRHKNPSIVENISLLMFKKKITELFDQVSSDGVQIEEKGKLATHNDTDTCTEIRGKEECTAGCHEICLKIEQITNSWTFFGINSKSTKVDKESYNHISTYGWSSDNYIWTAGNHESKGTGRRIEIQKNDKISLLLDCDNYTIAMLNGRTNETQRLDVDILNCPLPWQIQVFLCESKSRVHILSE